MKLISIPINSVSPHPKNYRIHSEAQLHELDRSLEKFGQVKNVVVWNGYIIAGEGLWKAAKERGDTEIYVVDKTDEWDENTALSFLPTDNETAAMARNDYAKLAILIAELDSDTRDIPGISDDEMRMYLEKAAPTVPDVNSRDEGFDDYSDGGGAENETRDGTLREDRLTQIVFQRIEYNDAIIVREAIEQSQLGDAEWLVKAASSYLSGDWE